MTRFLDPTHAVVAAGWLRSAGFEVELSDYYLCSLNWMIILALGGFGLDPPRHPSPRHPTPRYRRPGTAGASRPR